MRLESVTIKQRLKLQEISVRQGTFDLTGTRADFLFDDVETQQGSAALFVLTGFVYDRIHDRSPLDAGRRLAWLKKHDNAKRAWADRMGIPEEPPDPGPYRQLADVLRKQGHEGEAREVMRTCAERRMMPVVGRRWREGASLWWLATLGAALLCLVGLAWMEQPWLGHGLVMFSIGIGVIMCWLSSLTSGLRWFAGLLSALAVFATEWCYALVVGHGYARWRVLVWALVFVVLGVGVFGHQDHRRVQPAQPLALKAWEEAKASQAKNGDDPALNAGELDGAIRTSGGADWVGAYPRFNAVVYSLDTFLPLVSFHQEGYWTLRNGPMWSGRWWAKQVYLPVHIAAGWVVATLFVASFTGLMRPE